MGDIWLFVASAGGSEKEVRPYDEERGKEQQYGGRGHSRERVRMLWARRRTRPKRPVLGPEI